MTGLDQFKLLLAEFRNLSIWAAGGTVILPFVASFISVIPPWPSGLNIMTAVFQLVSLMFVYQMYFDKPRDVITRNIGILALSSFVIILTYMMVFSLFTIYVPQAKRSIIVGYNCLPNAMRVFAEKCPFLDLDDLASVSFDEFLLWTKPSIAIIRGGLVGLWFLFFICLSALTGQFLVYQMRRRLGKGA